MLQAGKDIYEGLLNFWTSERGSEDLIFVVDENIQKWQSSWLVVTLFSQVLPTCTHI
jgi:hypothetical protein